MKGFIFHRNLTTNNLNLDYDYYFYSSELVYPLADCPDKYKKDLEKNLEKRNKFTLEVIKELEFYLKKPIQLINSTNYKTLKQKYNIKEMHMHLPLLEQSALTSLVDKVTKVQYKDVSTQNFTRFYSQFNIESTTFTPRIKSEQDVLKLILDYPIEKYCKRRTLIKPSGLLISKYISIGVISTEQVLGLIKRVNSEGKDQLTRQLTWFFYCKAKSIETKLPPLTKVEEQKFYRYITGTLEETGVEEKFVNAQIKDMINGEIISNRARLMLSYYFIIRLGLYWEYGELYFRSVLTDYHPAVNRYNWYAQSRNRFLKSYNLSRQIALYGE